MNTLSYERGFYQEVLDRSADALYQRALATALQGGLADELGVAILASSDEYFSK